MITDHKLFENTRQNRYSVTICLTDGPVLLEFTKRDGTVRFMRATLDPSEINYEYKTERRKPEKILSVWDLDELEWRSFAWARLNTYICLSTES